MILSGLYKLPHIIYVALPLAILVGTILYRFYILELRALKEVNALLKSFIRFF